MEALAGSGRSGFAALPSRSEAHQSGEIVLFPLTFRVLPALLIVFLGPPLLSLAS